MLKKEKNQMDKAKFVKYSQRFTYDLGLLADVEHAGGFERLYQQMHDYFYHLQYSNHDAAEEPNSNRPVAGTSANRDGLHRTSGTPTE